MDERTESREKDAFFLSAVVTTGPEGVYVIYVLCMSRLRVMGDGRGEEGA